MIKVTVFGASGLVGRVLVERLSLHKDFAVRAVIHSSGNAWGLARSGMELTMASLASKEQIARAVEGTTHVVNCVRPHGDAVRTTDNLLEVCRANNIQRLVHLSSIAVYGDPPAAESIHESAPPNVKKRSYGWAKLQQDRLIARAHRRGLSCVVLCPANITGMRSKYLLGILAALREGRLALVDDGRRPYCSTDVINLCAAIEAALTVSEADGRRIYINDGPGQTWRDLVDNLMELADGRPGPPSITEARARAIIARRPAGETSLPDILKAIVKDAGIRDLVRRHPALGSLYRGLRSSGALLPPRPHARLMRVLEGRFGAFSSRPPSLFDAKLCKHQLRNLVPSTERARDLLGYAPPLSFAQSMAMFRAWYRQAHGYDDPAWALLRLLYPHA